MRAQGGSALGRAARRHEAPMEKKPGIKAWGLTRRRTSLDGEVLLLVECGADAHGLMPRGSSPLPHSFLARVGGVLDGFLASPELLEDVFRAPGLR